MTVADANRAGLLIEAEHATLCLGSGDRASVILERELSATASLASQLEELLAQRSGITALTVVVARPLAHLRTIALPSMPRDMAERVLERDWDRYVIGHASGGYDVAARPLERGHWVAAFIGAELVAQISSAADACGIASLSIATADDVLVTAAQTALPSHARRGDVVAVLSAPEGHTDIAWGSNGVPRGGRHLPSSASADDVVKFLHDHGLSRAPLVLFGDRRQGERLAEECARSGSQPHAATAHGDTVSNARSVLASLALSSVPVLPVHAPARRARVERSARAMTRWLLVGALFTFLGALVLEQAIVSRRVRAVREQRAAIAPSVARALALRDSVIRESDLLTGLAAREAAASRVGGVIASVVVALPRATTLSMIQIAGDSINIEGDAPNAADVYDALRKSGAIDQLKLSAPIRQTRTAVGDDRVDHFAFAGRPRTGKP